MSEALESLEDDDYEDECGLTYDHLVREITWRNGMTTYECRNCGAEWAEED